jgi:hypothetical protein
MMLPYVAWIAIWQAMYDPRLWIGAGSSPANARKDERLTGLLASPNNPSADANGNVLVTPGKQIPGSRGTRSKALFWAYQCRLWPGRCPCAPQCLKDITSRHLGRVGRARRHSRPLFRSPRRGGDLARSRAPSPGRGLMSPALAPRRPVVAKDINRPPALDGCRFRILDSRVPMVQTKTFHERRISRNQGSCSFHKQCRLPRCARNIRPGQPQKCAL